MDEREENLRAFRQRIRNSPNASKYNVHDLERSELEDWWLESFLKSRDYDLDVASAVFFECLKWRQNFGLHQIGLIELRSILERSFIYFHGNDIEDNRICELITEWAKKTVDQL
ncbi:hypothetical protein M3Y97_00895100 [Aphelenchoides bicaudatus]|nr:hypothetical protein M3Y97_00895100 [Aphelenchoides bicaudatus]